LLQGSSISVDDMAFPIQDTEIDLLQAGFDRSRLACFADIIWTSKKRMSHE
jgi:hypothetical protein